MSFTFASIAFIVLAVSSFLPIRCALASTHGRDPFGITHSIAVLVLLVSSIFAVASLFFSSFLLYSSRRHWRDPIAIGSLVLVVPTVVALFSFLYAIFTH